MFASSPQRRKQESRAAIRRHYHDRGWVSPYELYARKLEALLGPGSAVLDVGCGRSFPMARRLQAAGAEVFGLDPVADCDEALAASGVTVRAGFAEDIPYDSGSFDVVTCCAVLEHLKTPAAAFTEIRRVLKPGGRLVFLAAGRYDYVSIVGRLVPNRLHGWLVKATEGRDESDTFPTFYRANDMRQVRRLAGRCGFAVESMGYLNQYPYALTFSPLLCRAGIVYDRLITRLSWLNWLSGWLMGVLRAQEGIDRRGAEAQRSGEAKDDFSFSPLCLCASVLSFFCPPRLCASAVSFFCPPRLCASAVHLEHNLT